jgi:phage protein D
MGLLDFLSAKHREPAECVITVDGTEITDLYPFLMEARVETSRKDPWVATLQFESRRDETGKWLVQDAGVFRPWAPIVVEAAFGSSREEVMRGYVKQVDADYPEDPGTTTVTVHCQDDSLALDREHVRKPWGADVPTTDQAILAEILAGHGLAPHPESGAGLANLILNQNETDVRFLRKRAEANGYELIFEQGTVYFGPLRVDAEPQETILVYAGPDTHCFRFSVKADGHQPEQVAFDVAAEEGAERIEQVVPPDLPLMGTEPAESSGEGLKDFVWRLDRQGTTNEEELLARAQGKANELALKVKAEGELDGSRYGHVLRVGQPVGVDGVGEWLGGIYYVDKVTHLFNEQGYRQTFTLLRNAYGDNLAAGVSLLAGVL